MITKDNVKQLLPELGFMRSSKYLYEVWECHYDEVDATVYVDFANEKIVYPPAIQADRKTSQDFSHPEFFVVLECVCRLLRLGYKPTQIVLEPKTPGGREDTHFYCDILVRNNDNVPYMLIECKNAGDDYDDEWKKMKRDGGQLFRYYNTYRQAEYLCLYSSDFVDGKPKREYELIKMSDNAKLIQEADVQSYAKVSATNGSFEDYFNVWAETYEYDSMPRGAFEDSVPPFGISNKRLNAEDDLDDVDNEEIKKKYNRFAEILRQHNVGSHENAFDKLVNLFLAKVVDEKSNPEDLHFFWKGKSYDDDFSLQDRLQRLYRDGMYNFLHEEVTYIEDGQIDKAFRWVQNDLDATKRTIREYFHQLKFYSDNDFSFISVHNKRLFEQNAEILRKVVKMLQNIRLRTKEENLNQLLGDLFEGFLNKGVKQNEGQFFTPMPIVRFIVSALPLEQIIRDSPKAPYAIDYACGAGHFLTEYDFRITEFAKKYHADIPLSEYFAHTYGIEKEYRLSKVTKVSAFMYGHDDTTVIYADALNHIDEVKDNMFSVLVANPPYAVSGFLETLPEKERKRYTLYNKDINLDKNNAIETFFMERSAQLMKADGVAGIVLPISVLNKDGIYTHAREIILQNFDIIALAKFGSGTFGKTGTSTVVMFLRRKETNTPEAEHYRSRVKSWFDGQHNADEVYKDADLLDSYCTHMGYDIEDYRQFLNGSIPERMNHTEVIQNYRESFFGNQRNAMKGVCKEAKKIRTKFKAREKTATYQHMQEDERNRISEEAFFAFVKAIEKDKVFYYILAYKAPCPVILMNMPSGKENESATKEGQKFLGYKWSDTKGNEGIKYLHVKKKQKKNEDEEDGNAEDDDTMQQIRGINGIVTPLFNPADLYDESKINSIIRKNYLNEEIVIPNEIEGIVKLTNLVEMMDFSHTAFIKELPTNKANIIKYESRYELTKLSSIVSEDPQYGANEAAIDGNRLTDYRYIRITDIQNDGTLNDDWKTVAQVEDKYILREGDLLFARSGATAGKFFYYKNSYGKALYAGYLIRFRFNKSIVQPLYVYQFLFSQEYNDWVQKTRGGSGQPNINAQQFSSFEIPLPPISVQQQIIDECAIIDRQQEEKERRMNEILEEMVILRNSVTGDFKRLKDILTFVTERTAYADIAPESFITTDNMLQDCEGVKPYDGNPEVQSVIEYHKGDILLSNIRPYLKKLWLADRDGGCNPDVLVLRANNQAIDSSFVYYLLRCNAFFDYIMEDVKGMKMPRGKKEHIEKYELRLPSLEEQQRLSKMFADLDMELVSLKVELQTVPQCKQAVLDKYLK